MPVQKNTWSWIPGKTFLELGRVSNLPTIWSNCLCAAWLCGVISVGPVVQLCLGVSLLYTAGMFMNDYCDRNFDREHKVDRPIAKGEVGANQVLFWTSILLGAGFACFFGLAWKVGVTASLLLATVIAYNVIHKKSRLIGVYLMATCRGLIYPLGAIAFVGQLTTANLIAGLFMACYVAGLSLAAIGESGPKQEGFRYRLLYSRMLLASPLAVAVYAILQNQTSVRCITLVILLCALWLGYCLKLLHAKQIGASVSRMLAGIVWIDMLLIAALRSASLAYIAPFLALFLVALLWQRYIKAT